MKIDLTEWRNLSGLEEAYGDDRERLRRLALSGDEQAQAEYERDRMRRGASLEDLIREYFRELGFSTQDLKIKAAGTKRARIAWTLKRPNIIAVIKGSLWLWATLSQGPGANGLASVYVHQRPDDAHAGTVIAQVKAGSVRGVLERLTPYYEDTAVALRNALLTMRREIERGNVQGKKYVAGGNLRALNDVLARYKLSPVPVPQ